MKYIIASLFLFLCFTSSAQEKEATAAWEYYNAANYKKAIKSMKAAISKDPKNVNLRNDLGWFYNQAGLFQEAYDSYKSANDIEENYSSYNGIGMLYESMGGYKNAIKAYNECIKLTDNDTMKVSAVKNRAVAKMKVRQFQESYDDLMLCYEFDSTDLVTLNNLATVCSEVGKGEKVPYYLQKVIEKDSIFIGSYVNMGYHYQELKQYEKAQEYFDKAVQVGTRHLSPAQTGEKGLMYSNRAFNYYYLGNYEAAMEDIQKSIKYYPGNSYAYRVRAMIYLAQGKKEKACEDVNKGLKMGYTEMYGNHLRELRQEACDL